jgi:TonB family protein
MKHLFIISLLSLQLKGNAQQDTLFYDLKWKQVGSREEATYFRIIQPNNEVYRVQDFYTDNNGPYRDALCRSIAPELVLEGKAVFYYHNGNKRMEGVYQNDRKNGVFLFYYPSGGKKAELEFLEDQILYKQHWTESGDELIIEGNGLVFDPLVMDIPFSPYRVIENNRVVNSFSLRPTGDSVYVIVDQIPEYPNGMRTFYKELQSKLSYPREARKKGIEGKVFIQFIVQKDGSIAEEQVIKGIGGGCDEAALAAFRNMGKWTPGTVRGKPVKVMWVLPVAFVLN